jgi:L-rhamnose mutarotase
MRNINTIFIVLLFALSFTAVGVGADPAQAQNKQVKQDKDDYPMKLGSLIKLRPEFQERYIILHRHTFPEVLIRIRKSKIRNFSIFLLKGMLFSYMEYTGYDYKKDMDRIAADRVTRDWWKLTDPMQEPLPDRKSGEWWASMEMVLYLQGQEQPGKPVKRFAFVCETGQEFDDRFKEKLTAKKSSIAEPMEQSNCKNLGLFRWKSRLYLYFEYVGRHRKKDLNNFLGSLKKLPGIKNSLPWEEMREVFHTD